MFRDGRESVLDAATPEAWNKIRPYLPPGAYLAGGPAIAVHLAHRVSRDLDFFTTEHLDVEALLDALTESVLVFTASQVAPRGRSWEIVLRMTKIDFTDATGLTLLEPTETVAGIEIAGLGDLMAMTLVVMTTPAQLRDDEDLRAIEQRGGRRVEEVFALYAQRDGVGDVAGILAPVRALAAVGGCGGDPLVTTPRPVVLDYWTAHLAAIVACLSRWHVGEPPADIAVAVALGTGPGSDAEVDAPC